jgi:hypothetical protein
MNLFQIGLLFSLPVHTYVMEWLINPEVVSHPYMAKTTVMHANSLPPFWYG